MRFGFPIEAAVRERDTAGAGANAAARGRPAGCGGAFERKTAAARDRRARLSRLCPLWLVVVLVAIQGPASSSSADGADNLRLAPGLSFTDDSSDNFPIRGDHLDDAEPRSGRPTVMFFGASHCWNTNREAERLVALYPKYRDRVSFIIVDVARPLPPHVPLLKTYYRGSIPTVVILGRDGMLLYAQAGETARTRGDTQALDSLIIRAVGDALHLSAVSAPRCI